MGGNGGKKKGKKEGSVEASVHTTSPSATVEKKEKGEGKRKKREKTFCNYTSIDMPVIGNCCRYIWTASITLLKGVGKRGEEKEEHPFYLLSCESRKRGERGRSSTSSLNTYALWCGRKREKKEEKNGLSLLLVQQSTKRQRVLAGGAIRYERGKGQKKKKRRKDNLLTDREKEGGKKRQGRRHHGAVKLLPDERREKKRGKKRGEKRAPAPSHYF